MTEAISTRKSSQKRVETSSEKLQRRTNSSCLLRSSNPYEAKISEMNLKHEKRTVEMPVQKKVGGNIRLKQSLKNQSLSLDSFLKGTSLSVDQIKKKEMLETWISRGSSEKISLSQYLHESGFTYENQASLVSVKKVEKYMINYLAALFFRESENPLEGENLDRRVLRRISNKWPVVKDIVVGLDSEITPEKVVLILLKNFGCAYESLIIFLDLFESEESFLSDRPGKRVYSQYKDLKYPFSKRQFMCDVIEVAKGGHVSLKGFVDTFLKPSSEEMSEWETLTRCFWDENFIKDSNVSEEMLLKHFKKCVKATGGINNKKAFVECLKDVNCNFLGKEQTFLNFLRSEEGGGVSSSEAIQIISRCIGADGGSKNMQAFIDCLSKLEIDLDGEKVSIYMFLVSNKGGCLSYLEAIHMIEKCTGAYGGAKNKHAFIDCLNKLDIDLNGERVSLYRFLISDKGGCLSSSDAVNVIIKCMGGDGGSKNKQALLGFFCEKKIELGGRMISLYEFLCSKLGGGLSSFEAISVITRCLTCAYSSKNSNALIDCFSQPEINLNGKMVSFYTFFCSKKGGGYSTSEAINMIKRCVSARGGFVNKQALIECFNKPDINLDGKMVSLFDFLTLKKGGELSTSQAVNDIIKCVGVDGGCKNKKALMAFFCEREILLGKEKVSVYKFLISKQGGCLAKHAAIKGLMGCVSEKGGANNKQALLECLSKPEIDLDGKKVCLFTFLKSIRIGDIDMAEDALWVILRCIGHGGGVKNKQALIECFTNLDIGLDGQMVSLYNFLISDRGGYLNEVEAIQVIVRCIGKDSGSISKKLFVDCLTKQETDLGGLTLYDFIKSELDGDVFESIQIIVRCIAHHGSSKNKEALINCFFKPEVVLDDKMVSLYTFLRSENGGRLSASESMHEIAKCIGRNGGAKNKGDFIKCLMEPELNLGGEEMSLYTFLCLGGVSSSEAIKMIVRCLGYGNGEKNKQVLMESLSKPVLDLDGKKVSLYTFLCSKKSVGVSTNQAIQIIVKCVSQNESSKKNQTLMECLMNLEVDLVETFLSANMNLKEAISLCLIFSFNRQILNAKDVLTLFQEGGNNTLASMFNSLNISCYTTIRCLVKKAFSDFNRSLESKRASFKSSCQFLFDVFLRMDGFFVRKRYEHLSWSETMLGEKCIEACVLYNGKDIHTELKAREKRIVEWICQFESGYQLTKESLEVMTHVQSLGELNTLIELCDSEILLRQIQTVDATYCEAILKASLQILMKFEHATIQEILKNKSILLNWFDLDQLSQVIIRWYKNTRMTQSLAYFFKNKQLMQSCLFSKDLKKVFLDYMGLSVLTPFLRLPLTLDRMQKFLGVVGKEFDVSLVIKKRRHLFLLYTIYNYLPVQKKKDYLHIVAKGIKKIFYSYEEFQDKYQNKIQKKDWPLLFNLIEKWDFEKENLTQEDLSFLIRISYQLPEEIVVTWADLSRLENCEKGCCVVNQTRYPNWVFVLAYLQKISNSLSDQWCVSEKKDSIVFQSHNENVTAREAYHFPLFRIILNQDGFVFVGESMASVMCFYSTAKIDDYFCFAPLGVSIVEAMLGRKRKRSDDEKDDEVRVKYQKKLEGGNGEARLEEKESRKRDATHIDTDLPCPKEIKLLTRQEVFNLYETVSAGTMLTEKDCEFFMQGACYLTEAMLDLLIKKSLVIEIGNKDIREKWHSFVQRHHKKKFEKKLEMQEAYPLFLEGVFKEDDVMFSQLDESLLTPIPEFKENDNSCLPITFDSIFDFFEQDFEHSYEGFL